MALWREGGFAADEWTTLADDAALVDGKIIVSLKRWRLEQPQGAGVQLDAGKDAQSALAEVADRPLLALKFDKFGDGRAFSYASLLRQRYGFRGELRAVGDVLLDEIPLMLRCGFTSFEVTSEPTLRALREGRAPKFPVAYQPGLSAGEARVPARAWGWRLQAGTASGA
jgi:phosphoadenosine phosphosulfate reductase